MAIKLNDKWYDESKFNAEIKNSIIQVNNYQQFSYSTIFDRYMTFIQTAISLNRWQKK